MLNAAGSIVAPGVFDAMGARAAQSAGFQAVYMTGNGSMASLLGKPDLGLATMSEMVGRAHQIASCVDIPLICDADTGYGGLGNIRRTVEEFEAAGVAAIHIEDQVMPKRCGALGGVQLVPLEESVDRIRAAMKARTVVRILLSSPVRMQRMQFPLRRRFEGLGLMTPSAQIW